MAEILSLNFEERCKGVHCVVLGESFPTSICYVFAKFGFDTAENEPFNFHNFSSLQGFNFHRAVVSEVKSQRVEHLNAKLHALLEARRRGELTMDESIADVSIFQGSSDKFFLRRKLFRAMSVEMLYCWVAVDEG